MPFLVPFTSFGHWSVPTLISGILLLLFLGVKGIDEATHAPFACEFETTFSKNKTASVFGQSRHKLASKWSMGGFNYSLDS